jgi:WD40 repeat protein
MRVALTLVVWLAGPALLAWAQEAKQPYSYGSLPRHAWACLGSPRFVADRPVTSITFSPDGKLLAAITASDLLSPYTTDVRLWELATGKELPPLRWQKRIVSVVRFTPDGKKLIVALSDNSIRLWDLVAGKEERRFNGSSSALELTPDGRRLISACWDDTIRVWDFATAEEVRCLKCKAQFISLAPDGRTLATSGAVMLWDVQTGKALRQPDQANEAEFRYVCFSSDGKTLAALNSSAGEVVLWDLPTGKERLRLKGRGRIDTIALSHSGKVLATDSNPGWERDTPDDRPDLQFWDVSSGKKLGSCVGETSGIIAIAFSANDELVATVRGHDPLVRLWDWKNGRELSRFAGHGQDVTALAFSPDGHTLYSASNDRTVRVWDAERYQEQAILRGHSAYVTSFTLTLDGKTLITGSRDHTVRLWDLAGRRELRKLATAHGWDRWMGLCVTLSPDGRTLVTSDDGDGGNGQTVRFWDWRAGKQLRRLKGLNGAHCLTFAPDGKTLAAGFHGSISVWEADTGKLLRGFEEAHNLETMALAFLRDGTLASAGGVNEVVRKGMRPRNLKPRTAVRLWDPATGARLHEFAGTEGEHTTLALSPDGRLLAGAFETIIRVWEVSNWHQVSEFQGHRGYVSVLAFNPDGRTLASGGADGAILFWDLTGRRKDGRLAGPALTPAQLDASWESLAYDDGRPAVWALAAAPAQSVPFLRLRLSAVPKLNKQRVKRLIADLDAEKFAVREKATSDIEQIGEVVVPALRMALKDNPTLEQGRRLQALLDKLDRQREKKRLPPSLVRVLRALEALERAGTPEAVEVLREIAAGEPTARPTREAQAALKRLAQLSK